MEWPSSTRRVWGGTCLLMKVTLCSIWPFKPKMSLSAAEEASGQRRRDQSSITPIIDHQPLIIWTVVSKLMIHSQQEVSRRCDSDRLCGALRWRRRSRSRRRLYLLPGPWRAEGRSGQRDSLPTLDAGSHTGGGWSAWRSGRSPPHQGSLHNMENMAGFIGRRPLVFSLTEDWGEVFTCADIVNFNPCILKRVSKQKPEIWGMDSI